MKAVLVRLLAGLVTAIILALPTTGYPQNSGPYSDPELEQLVAPIALYPDKLLGQVLMASTYPLEVVEASRWIQKPYNANLGGNALAEALQPQDWAPSVKSLVPFPDILKMMDENLRWTQQLGDAFLAQEADVMDAIQRLRERAYEEGNLRSTPQQRVIVDGKTIDIVEADPEIIYVPYYDPVIVYGVWPYPAYPPYTIFVYSTYGRPLGSWIHFSVGFRIVFPLWGWDHCDWHHHRIRIDHARFNTINRSLLSRYGHPRVTSSTWVHNAFHRRSVPYRDERSRERFTQHRTESSETRRDYRGFAREPVVSPVITSPQQQGTRERRTEPRFAPHPTQQPGSRPPRPASVPKQPPQIERPSRETRTSPQRQIPRFGRPSTPSRPTSPAPARPIQRQTPPAFGHIDQGRAVRRDAERGRASRNSAGRPFRAIPDLTPNSGGQRKKYPDRSGDRDAR